jgi:hypothetical protein
MKNNNVILRETKNLVLKADKKDPSLSFRMTIPEGGPR